MRIVFFIIISLLTTFYSCKKNSKSSSNDCNDGVLFLVEYMSGEDSLMFVDAVDLLLLIESYDIDLSDRLILDAIEYGTINALVKYDKSINSAGYKLLMTEGKNIVNRLDGIRTLILFQDCSDSISLSKLKKEYDKTIRNASKFYNQIQPYLLSKDNNI